MLTRMTNSREVLYKNWIARCFPPRSRVLLEATNKLVKTFSIAFFLNFYYIFIIYDGRKSNKQQVKSNKQRPKSNKERAKIKEQRAKSNEQRAKRNAQQAKSNEQRAKISASFLYHSEHFYTRYLFYLARLGLQVIKLFSEINVLSETEVKKKLETNIIKKLFRKLAPLKTS